ncbi:hypothetical protein MCOR02_011061 [Pyricularia oryzae]|uniref:Uncharacterized protein n=2 Tax=Pyricularia TaxID=48558 RepID=A0ABQ8NK88_PYRGI|nr:hypothetical protein MCOR02_011061 [Pyricularia oryzae]KAI6298367.1 hypothetical protein MCOR33_005533 [Pyricularia grisea]KAI6258948.1 hypothetical protein MCOR19_004710 [Pyricularia oryzae]KAI6345265.1 hypothetical protein MCOR30_000986 [Pyricularia oryzae]KAI6350066.1 hypothetical protein MCOR31_012090 [Pyricularia oryzae]
MALVQKFDKSTWLKYFVIFASLLDWDEVFNDPYGLAFYFVEAIFTTMWIFRSHRL